jgi:hypothetical protein
VFFPKTGTGTILSLAARHPNNCPGNPLHGLRVALRDCESHTTDGTGPAYQEVNGEWEVQPSHFNDYNLISTRRGQAVLWGTAGKGRNELWIFAPAPGRGWQPVEPPQLLAINAPTVPAVHALAAYRRDQLGLEA